MGAGRALFSPLSDGADSPYILSSSSRGGPGLPNVKDPNGRMAVGNMTCNWEGGKDEII